MAQDTPALASPLIDILTLAPTDGGSDRFTGPSANFLADRIYGGQIVAQSLAAAQATISDARAAHSMHAYFIRGGRPDEPIDYQVDRLSDGRTLAHRRVQGMQGERNLFSSVISFAANDPGLEHQGTAPRVPGPDELDEGDADVLRAGSVAGFEFRTVSGADAVAGLGGDGVGRKAMWLRIPGAVPDDPRFHQQAIAYASDLAIFRSSLKVHDLTLGSGLGPGTMITSLDHALWWHEQARVDEWLLLVQEAPQARNNRSMNAAYFYSAEGALVASVAQEILFRVVPAG